MKPTIIMAGAVAVLGTACPERAAVWDDALESTGPLVAGGHLAWVRHPDAAVFWLDPSRADPPRALHLGGRVDAAAAGGDTLILSVGDGAAGTLALVSLPGGEVRRVSLPGRFGRVEVSPTGRHAVLLAAAVSGANAGGVPVRNNNEIVVVDVDGGTAVSVLLASESTAPRRVRFAPDEGRVAILLDETVAVVDVARPQRRVSVPLEDARGEALRPLAATFAPDGRHLFVRTPGPDVLALELTDGGGDDLIVGLNLIGFPGGEQIHDLAVLAAPHYDGRVIALASIGAQTVLGHLAANGDTSRRTFRALSRVADRLALTSDGRVVAYAGPALVDPSAGAEVALWDPASDRLEEDRLAGASLGLATMVPGAAVFVHADGTSPRAAFSALDLASVDARPGLFLRPLLVDGALRGYAARDGEMLFGVDLSRADTGAAPRAGTDTDFSGSTGSLALVDPTTLAVRSVVLDDEVAAVGLTSTFAFAVHPSALGDITVVPRGDLRRAAARRFAGVMLTALWEQGGDR